MKTEAEAGELRVIATAGHVDHGKSSLIVRLTGIDPDRWAEEKRRGLTIDLGYAWTTLPGGREIGFVDVPGHERFIRNMLAGVGPVRLVLFVVAADEGWKPQSEEHLQILDVLGVQGAVVALTKRDLVDDETLEMAREEIGDRVRGTVLDGAPIVPVSARTGDGVDALIAALQDMMSAAPVPEPERARLFVDRVFTITGAGTVVTGTLMGDCLRVGQDVAVEPGGDIARVRSLQTHKHDEQTACPVTRVAANLVGVERGTLERGDVIAHPGTWRATTMFDVWIRPVRGLDAIPLRGAFTVHAGAAGSSATLRLGPPDGDGRLARIRTARPMVLEPGDRFVLREEGRGATVGGGAVLDTAPPRVFGRPAHLTFLAGRREAPAREAIAALMVSERGAVRADEVVLTTESAARPDTLLGGWAVDVRVRTQVTDALTGALSGFHADHPLDEGMPLARARDVVSEAVRSAHGPPEPDLIDVLIQATADVVRTATSIRLATHRVDLDERSEDVARLRQAIGGEHEASPPGVADLIAAGFAADLIEAAARAGDIVKIAPTLVVHPGLVDRAMAVVVDHAADGVSVSTLREALGTSRKFAVPLVEWMDAHGLTRREGDLRFPR